MLVYINIISVNLANLACSPDQGQDCLSGLDGTGLAKLQLFAEVNYMYLYDLKFLWKVIF